MTTRSIFEVNLTTLESVENVSRQMFDEEIRPAGRPVIFKNFVGDWPAYHAGQTSLDALAAYLKNLDVGASTPTFIAPADVQGRYFYAPDMRGFNFDKREIPLGATIDKLMTQRNADQPLGIYAGASPTTNTLPGFADDNRMPLLEAETIPKVWIGNSAQIAPHFDMSENIACIVSGTRRFVVFPPQQISNLYVGPIDYNMAGQPASMVDLNNIDLDKFPKFETAMSTALMAELSPGDAIYLPSLWWHFVESMGPFNVLVNYWWDDLRHGSPMNVLALALLVMRDLPDNDRSAWEHIFRHYVFAEQAAHALDHVPEAFRGVLGTPSDDRDSKIKAFLRDQLSKILS